MATDPRHFQVGRVRTPSEQLAHELNNVAAIMRHWFVLGFPDDYLFIDVETTGREFGMDLITEVGWSVVRGRRIECFGGQLLDWSRVLSPADWAIYCQRLHDVNAAMLAKGRPFHITPERLQAEGGPPIEILQEYAGLLADAVHRQELIIGHNAWFFDWAMVDSNLYRFCGQRLPWHDNALFDTGLVERAAQLDRLPWPGESCGLPVQH